MKTLRQCLLGILCLTSAVGVPLLAAEGPGDPATSANPSLSVIGPAPAFTLHDTAGKVVRLSDYQGRVVLLAFIFTSCRGVCPLISRQMAAVQAGLKSAELFGRRASLVSVTVDPATDTADVLARYSRDHGADPTGWRFLTDRPERIKPVLKAYDEWTRLLLKGEIDHPARVYLIDQQSNIREIYSLAFFNEKQALIDMRALLKD
jgi:protein SCO1